MQYNKNDDETSLLVIFVVIFWFIPFISTVVHVVRNRDSMLHDEKCSGNLCERWGVCVRGPQDDVSAMHILQEGPPIGAAEFRNAADLQKAAGGGDPCRCVPVTLNEDVTQSVWTIGIHPVLDDGVYTTVADLTLASFAVDVLLEHIRIVCDHLGLLQNRGEGELV